MSRWLGAIAIAATLGLLVAVSLHRVMPFDVPIHLVTGQRILETGTFPTTNTFSWTFPDFPLHQQYPLTQTIAWLLVDRLGFGALSVLCAAGWLVAVLTWMRWAGPPQRWAATPMLWTIAVVGVARHAVQRPEIVTVWGLGALLLAFDAWRRGHPRALWALPAVTWLMVTSHQLYVVGVLLQLGFVVHLLGSRHLAPRLGLSAEDAALPLRPLLLAVLASLAGLALSPLGLGVYTAPLALLGTLAEHGAGGSVAHSQELAPFWTDPFATLVVAVLGTSCAVQLARTRGRWPILELGVLAMGTGMVLVAVRGIPFFAVAAAAVASRLGERAEAPLVPPRSPLGLTLAGLATALAVLLTLVRASGPHTYLARELGVGRARGIWPDATLAFLEASPPAGRVLNVGWVSGNVLIWAGIPVFVDGRWEAYPRDFLLESIAAMESTDAFGALIAEHRPGWMVGEMRLPEVQARAAELLSRRDWSLVHLDQHYVVMVRHGAQTDPYVAEHAADVTAIPLPDWSAADQPVLRAQEQIRVARFLRLAGDERRSAALLEAAAPVADHPAVAADLQTVAAHPVQ